MNETSSPLNILFAGNNENERLLFRQAFQKSDMSCKITECTSAEQVMEQLGSETPSFDVVVVDYNLTGISGMDLCRKLLDEKIPLPLVLLAETGCEQRVAEALKAGVHHYIIKDPEQGYLKLLPISLIKILNRTEKQLRDSKYLLEKMFSSLDIAVFVLDNRIPPRIINCNPAAVNIFGYQKSQLVGQTTDMLHVNADSLLEFQKTLYSAIETEGHLKSIEFRMKRKNGQIFPTEHFIRPLENEDGDRIGWISVVSDITERKKAENALAQSEEKFRLAMEATNDALWDWNMVTNEVYRNPRHATMLGYEPHELTTSQDEWEKRIHPNDRQAVFQILGEHLSGKRDSFEIEYRLRTKAGDYRWILGRGKVISYNNDGSPERMIGTNIDITDRKNLLERNEVILKTCIDGFWLIDTHGRILEVNDAYCRMSGYSRDELLTMSIQDVEAEEEPQEISQHIQEVRSKGSHRFESRHRRKDGKIMDLDISAHYLELDGGRLFTFFRDITAAKQVDKEIRKFKTIADKAGHGIGIADLQNNIVYVNNAYAQMHQYNMDELIGKKISILHTEEQMDYANLLIDQIKQKGGFVTEEVWHKRRDNTVFPTLMSATLIKDELGEPLFMAATAIDITKHKEAEELLRYSEERYRSVVEDSPVLLSSILPDGEIIFANAAYCTYFGKSRTELIGSNFKYLIPEADRQAVMDNIMSLTIDTPTMTHEHKVYSPDGQIRWQRWTKRALFDERGHLVSLQAFGEDITDRKNMEEALQESELRYHTLFEILPVGVGLSKLDGRIIDVNSTFQQMLGYPIDEISRISAQDTYYNPEERPPLMNRLQQDGSVRGFEVQLKSKNGTIFLADLNVTLMKMRGESVIVTVVRDITEQRRMERALAESEEKYRTLVEGAGDPIFTVDEKGVFLFANKVAAETVGYQQEGLEGKTLWDIFSKDTADHQAANIREVIETGQGINRISLTEVQNKSRWYSTTIEPLRDERGRTTAVMVIARDVDDMKRAEEQIQKLSSAVESSINGIVIGNIEGNLTYVNNSFLKMWGYEDQSEVLGRNAAQFWNVNNKATEIGNALLNGEGWIGELTAVRKGGSLFDVQVCQTSIRDENNKIISLMASFVDITESKRREDELSQYRGQMARAEQLASLGTLSATIAHQLTQPLTVIRLSIDNALDELEASSSSQTVIRRLKDSVTQVSNITSIIERFRNFARKSSGRTVSEVSLKAVAVRIAGLLSESARSASITLRIRNMDDLPCPWMNENDLEQLFFALIGNAIQAADGKKSRQLVISGAVKDKYIELRLSDDCGGIAPENIDKIFEPFFTTKPRGQGTGLGLCIVKDIVSRIGGHVRVESKFGKGTTFIINIPIEKDKIS